MRLGDHITLNSTSNHDNHRQHFSDKKLIGMFLAWKFRMCLSDYVYMCVEQMIDLKKKKKRPIEKKMLTSPLAMDFVNLLMFSPLNHETKPQPRKQNSQINS